MKPSASPLNIVDYTLLAFNIELVHGQEDGSVQDIFPRYEIDIDFGIHKKGNNTQVFMNAAINSEKKLPGYLIGIEIGCIYDLDENVNISDKAKNDILGYSTLYMSLNVMRTFISQITAIAPLGKYILPSIDLNDLIDQKRKESIPKDTDVTKEKSSRVARKSQVVKKGRNKKTTV